MIYLKDVKILNFRKHYHLIKTTTIYLIKRDVVQKQSCLNLRNW